MLENLKEQVCRANLELVHSGLVTLTWGNVSGIDREQGIIAIKPSGVPYDQLQVDQIVLVDMDGNTVEGRLKPSSDTPTHIRLYREFSRIGGITHTHSAYATAFAQSGWEIPCLGTTHADHFCGSVPLARSLSAAEVADDYEGNTGQAIVERFLELDPVAVPGVLVHYHGPFAWGRDAGDSVRNSIALESIAQMAWHTLLLNPDAGPLPSHILDRHYSRKHGPGATYGQGRD